MRHHFLFVKIHIDVNDCGKMKKKGWFAWFSRSVKLRNTNRKKRMKDRTNCDWMIRFTTWRKKIMICLCFWYVKKTNEERKREKKVITPYFVEQYLTHRQSNKSLHLIRVEICQRTEAARALYSVCLWLLWLITLVPIIIIINFLFNGTSILLFL